MESGLTPKAPRRIPSVGNAAMHRPVPAIRDHETDGCTTRFEEVEPRIRRFASKRCSIRVIRTTISQILRARRKFPSHTFSGHKSPRMRPSAAEAATARKFIRRLRRFKAELNNLRQSADELVWQERHGIMEHKTISRMLWPMILNSIPAQSSRLAMVSYPCFIRVDPWLNVFDFWGCGLAALGNLWFNLLLGRPVMHPPPTARAIKNRKRASSRGVRNQCSASGRIHA